MLRLKFLIGAVLIANLVFSQNSISGKIYGEKAVAKHIKVLNITQGLSTFSDDNGNFEIAAIEADSITFSSSFYETKTIIVNTTHFSEALVVQLKEKINKLDEVTIKNEPKVKEFNPGAYSLELTNQIKEDVKNNPLMYGINPYQFNLMYFIKLALKLFQNKKDDEPIKTIAYTDLKTLFSDDDNLFNDALIKQLKIPLEYKPLFFDFCDAKKINYELLADENRFLLLDKLITLSSEFLALVDQETSIYNETLIKD